MIHRRLSEGADFAGLAADLKYDPGYDEKGGLLHVDGKTDLPSGNFPAEERIARELKDGQSSKPIELPEAWLLVKREGYRPGVKQTWEQAAEKAAALAFEERLAAKKAEFFEKLKKQALIEIVQPELPAKWLK
jgi:parvulin-like peptidyl-prolyl isomerase